MPVPLNEKLYQQVKTEADKTYLKPSAYKSGFIVKRYKELGGKYKNDRHEKSLKRWFREKWTDIGHKSYPVYRPTRRINKHTPLLASEIATKRLQQQIRLKQRIKGQKNLPAF